MPIAVDWPTRVEHELIGIRCLPSQGYGSLAKFIEHLTQFALRGLKDRSHAHWYTERVQIGGLALLTQWVERPDHDHSAPRGECKKTRQLYLVSFIEAARHHSEFATVPSLEEWSNYERDEPGGGGDNPVWNTPDALKAAQKLLEPVIGPAALRLQDGALSIFKRKLQLGQRAGNAWKHTYQSGFSHANTLLPPVRTSRIDLSQRWEERLNTRENPAPGRPSVNIRGEYAEVASKFERWKSNGMKELIGFDDVPWPVLRLRHTIVPEDMDFDGGEFKTGQVTRFLEYQQGQNPTQWNGWRKKAALVFHDDRVKLWIKHVHPAEQVFVHTAAAQVIQAINAMSGSS